MTKRPVATATAQRGAVTLMMSLIILVLLTIMVMVSSELYTVEQRSTGNEIRERQALEAAMTGLELAMAYIAENGPDADGNGTADAIAAPDADPANRTAVVSGGNYAVEICDPDIATYPLPSSPTGTCTAATYAPDKFRKVLIYARGWSDDNTGIRHVIAVLEKTPGVANAPGNPLTTRGTAAINGSGDVTNPEGRTTIWSGQSVDFTNANFKTNILSPSGTSIIESSSNNSIGVDVIQNDGNISNVSGDAFFANFFGTTPTAYKDTYATQVFSAADIGNYDDVAGDILWSEGDTSTSGNLTFGTADDPVILIIDGNFDTGGTVTVNGLLYVIGDMTGNGNTTVNGAVVVQGNTDVSGSLDVVFDSSLLNNLGGVGQATISPGSWKDWKEW